MTDALSPGDALVIRYGEQLLERADVRGIVPTPLDEIAAALDVRAFVDTSALPDGLTRIRRRGRLRRVVGAFMFRQRVAVVNESERPTSYRWIKAHELGHALLPWHEKDHRLDSRDRLTLDTAEEEEAQANMVAAHLLFQGQVFFDRALSYQNGVAVPIYLADDFGASRHSTIRYYVEHHPDALGLLCASKYVQNGHRSIIYDVASPAFAYRFGTPRHWFSHRGIPVREPYGSPGVVEATRTARDTFEPQGFTLRTSAEALHCEAYYNGHHLFILMQAQRKLKLGRRIKIETAD